MLFSIISVFVASISFLSYKIDDSRNNCDNLTNFSYDSYYAPIYRPEEEYSFHKALLDVGVYPTRSYFGNDINVGIIENAFIENNDEIKNVICQGLNSNVELKHIQHANNVGMVLAGNDSIASNCTLLNSSLSSNSEEDCFAWLLNNDVDIINSSTGLVAEGENVDDIGCGKYSIISALIDYCALLFGVSYVTAIGNSSSVDLVANQSLALNAISVGASTSELIAATRVNPPGLDLGYEDVALSPTILAPGSDLFNIKGINYDSNDLISGTSWSAPIVSGIVALLMEEFPFLKGHPEMVIPLICNTATKAANQTEFVDRTNGFGIINYSEAQKAANNTRSIVLDSNTPADSLIYEEYITLQANESIDITAFTLFNPLTSLDSLSDLLYDPINVNPSSMQFSKVKIKLIDTMKNHAVYSDSISNFSYVSDINPLYTHTYKVEVYLDGEQKEPLTTKIGLNYNIHKGHDIELDLIDGNYLDECPTFKIDASDYNQTQSYYDYDVTLVFVGQDGKVLFKKENLDRIETITLTEDEWDEIISLRGREYYAYVECTIDDNFFVSKPFVFYEPEDFNNLIQIKPHEYNFEQQYFFEEKTTNFIKNDVNFSTKRLRCGYIEDTYVVLSPRNINAGTAYFELTFDRPMYGFMVGITMWTESENIIYPTATGIINYKDSNGAWKETFDFLSQQILPYNRMDIFRYSAKFNNPIYGIQIVVANAKLGSSNKGRICIDDIVLIDNISDDFISTKYESIVEDDEYHNLRFFFSGGRIV